jgi:hypothetical protein
MRGMLMTALRVFEHLHQLVFRRMRVAPASASPEAIGVWDVRNVMATEKKLVLQVGPAPSTWGQGGLGGKGTDSNVGWRDQAAVALAQPDCRALLLVQEVTAAAVRFGGGYCCSC